MDATKRNTFSLRLAAVSLLLGTAGAIILSDQSWGASLPIFVGFLIVQVLVLARLGRQPVPARPMALLLAAFLFSLCFLWRAAPELKTINGLAVFALIGLAAAQVRGKALASAPLAEFCIRALGLWMVFVADFFLLISKDVKWAKAFKENGIAGASAAVRGALIAIPLVAVFGALLVSADAAFQRFLEQFANFDGASVATHLFIGGACAVLTGGFLRHFFLRIDGDETTKPTPPFILAPGYHSPYPTEPFRLGSTELGIILGSLNALFGLFVLVEAPYLFGGAKHVLATEGLSYAEYARRGFFELVAVVALAIPVLLGSHALIKRESAAAERIWRGMAIAMVSLLFVVMHSAADRMRLYVDLYSLTTQRLYVLASLGWMAATLLWFLVTTVRGRSERFAFGAFASLLVVGLVLNALNPDGLIVRINVAKAAPGKGIDGRYLRSLSADAAPALVHSFGQLDPQTRIVLARRWLDETARPEGWRSWTASRQAELGSVGTIHADLVREAAQDLATIAEPSD